MHCPVEWLCPGLEGGALEPPLWSIIPNKALSLSLSLSPRLLQRWLRGSTKLQRIANQCRRMKQFVTPTR